MNGYDPLALSIWFHSIVLGAVIPNALVRARAERGAIVGEPGWISDEKAFVLFIVGAFIAMLIEQTATGLLTSLLNLSFPIMNVILVASEYLLFKRLFLGRR